MSDFSTDFSEDDEWTMTALKRELENAKDKKTEMVIKNLVSFVFMTLRRKVLSEHKTTAAPGEFATYRLSRKICFKSCFVI